MKIYQVIECSGEWEDYHEWVVYTTYDQKKAYRIKNFLDNKEAMLMARPRWDCWYEPSWYRVDDHSIDKADDSTYAFLEESVKECGKLKSSIFKGR